MLVLQVLLGDCAYDGSDCVTSPNWPETYLEEASDYASGRRDCLVLLRRDVDIRMDAVELHGEDFLFLQSGAAGYRIDATTNETDFQLEENARLTWTPAFTDTAELGRWRA